MSDFRGDNWQSIAIESDTDDAYVEGTLRIEDVVEGETVRVFHPRHKPFGDPVTGTISGIGKDVINFTITLGNGTMRDYEGKLQVRPDDPTDPAFGFIKYLIIGKYKLHTASVAGDDGGWVATRPPG